MYLLSIIIPCYNSGVFLRKTIDMLDKEKTDHCEIIFIDDGSTDDTLDIIKRKSESSCNVRYITRENRGVSASRNEGMLAAEGKYVFFLDSDDEIAEGSVQYFQRIIEQYDDEKYDILIFGYKKILTDGKEIEFVNHALNGCELKEEKCADLFFRGLLFMNISSVLFRREYLEKNSLFFEDGIKIGEDYDFLRRAALYSENALYNSKICFYYKLRRGSATDGNRRYDSESFKSLLLSIKTADLAQNRLDKKTINYYLAARYSAHLFSYLRAPFKSDQINSFFLLNRNCLFQSMNRGRRKVMLAIYFFRILPIRMIFKMYK